MIIYHTKYFLKCILLLTAGTLLMGCPNTVTMKYREVLNFEVFDTNPAGQPHQTYGGGFALYRIESIDNTKQGAKTYIFKPEKLYFDNTVQHGWIVGWQHHVLGASWRAGNVTIPAGTTKVGGIGCIAVGTNGTAGNSVHSLSHNSSIDDDSVLLVREGSNSIPHIGTAFTHNLQNSCQ